MADQPEFYPEWAADDIQEVKVIDEVTVVLDNKLRPSSGWRTDGEKYRENLPRQYVNYNFDLINQWVEHLDQRYSVGDVITTTSVESEATISTRLGGTWTQQGTTTLGTANVKVYEKTA